MNTPYSGIVTENYNEQGQILIDFRNGKPEYQNGEEVYEQNVWKRFDSVETSKASAAGILGGQAKTAGNLDCWIRFAHGFFQWEVRIPSENNRVINAGRNDFAFPARHQC